MSSSRNRLRGCSARYAARPAVVDAVAALADGAPQLHAGVASNRVYDRECGAPEAAARAIATAADVRADCVIEHKHLSLN